MTDVVAVKMWGRRIGAVSMQRGDEFAAFEYDPAFAKSGIEVAPLVMPLSTKIYTFPNLPRESFRGLPGLLADSLPDKFGNALIDEWLARQGRSAASFTAVERLCYIGARGMGALEFEPAIDLNVAPSETVEVDALVELASKVLKARTDFSGSLHDGEKLESLRTLLRVGTSAGGARAKAVIAWNPKTEEIRSGQVEAGDGFEHWLLKLDGVTANSDKELNDPQGYGAVEFAYSLMARAAGVIMSDCRLLEEGERRHFMTRRFDRLPGGAKVAMQSLAALAHFDFNAARAHSYEQALGVIRRLSLPMADIEQQFRRMVFNVVARNHDDHVKNIAFLMDKKGGWSLSPAFDVTYAYNPDGAWTSRHQMTLNGKSDGFTLDDFRACARVAAMKRGRAEAIFDEVHEAVSRWPEFADEADVRAEQRDEILRNLRLDLST